MRPGRGARASPEAELLRLRGCPAYQVAGTFGVAQEAALELPRR